MVAEEDTKVAFGITAFGGKIHESITKKAAELADMSYGNLVDGVKWPDAPDEDENKKPNLTSYAKLFPVVGTINTPGTITNDSHYGKYQIWHSMTPNDGTGRIYSNGEVKAMIINQAVEWYEKAQSTDNTFHLGKVLHMVQDSYSRSHVMRDENDKIKSFQSYNEQDGHAHGLEDKPQIKTVIESNGIIRQVPDDWQKVPGAMQALDASTNILKLYKSGAGSKKLANYLLDKVYQFENEQTKDLPAGGSDPKYLKHIADVSTLSETNSANIQLTSFGQMGASHAATFKMAEHIPEQHHSRLQDLVNQRIVEHNLTVGLLEKTFSSELSPTNA